ncbi:MAG: bifunctional DNA primase/polymerase [Planctomycetaceae bacterium]|nr:bifunctional DNA primase/polymerase [Planctomycetaceae bacterium]
MIASPISASHLSKALEYHALGMSVIPLRPRTKIPALKWKEFQQRRPTETELQRWFGNDSDKGLAVVLGEVSGGLVCRDFDELDAYEHWAMEHPDLASKLPTVETHRGMHVYCRTDFNRTEHLGDGELRGSGYCVLPPSVHPDGGKYRWVIPIDCEIPRIELSETGFLPCNIEDTDVSDDHGGITHTHSQCPESSEFSTSSVSTAPSVLQERIDAAIERTLPTGPGKRHRKLFDLARELKAIEELTDLPAKDLKRIVRKWHGRAKANIKTQPFEESWVDFAEGWEKVRHAAGNGPIDEAFARAVKAGIPKVAEEYEQPELRILVSFCRELQRSAGEGTFFLDVRTAGRLLNQHHTTVWRWMRCLRLDGILELVSAGGRAERRASTYRYIASD